MALAFALDRNIMPSSLTNLQPGMAAASGDKLGDLVDKMDSVRLDSKADSETSEGCNSVAAPGRHIKHPLQNAWTLWFFKNDKSRSWEENQRPIITVTTVEDFWALYNHIEVASKLPIGSDYSLFKEGIFPDWEDPRNVATNFIHTNLVLFLKTFNRSVHSLNVYVRGWFCSDL